MASQKVYFDESGFTGNRLLDQAQKVFVYASVATTDEEARALVAYLISRYRVQLSELKGRALVRKPKGRQLVGELLDRCKDHARVIVSNKQFALCAKVFECIFEPVLRENSALFYDNNFHRFIANRLFIEVEGGFAGAVEFLTEFQGAVSDPERLASDALFTTPPPHESSFITLVREFALTHRAALRKEMAPMEHLALDQWHLELTQTSLHTLLAHWGARYPVLSAVCDDSKPLRDSRAFFDAMVGDEGRDALTTGKTEACVSFCLSGPIEIANSKETPGIQLADCIAAAFNFIVHHPEERSTQRWHALLDSCAVTPVYFEQQYIDPARQQVQVNALLLQEIVKRSKTHRSTIKGIDNFYRFVNDQIAKESSG